VASLSVWLGGTSLWGPKIEVPPQPNCPDGSDRQEQPPRVPSARGPSVPVRYVAKIPHRVGDIAQLGSDLRHFSGERPTRGKSGKAHGRAAPQSSPGPKFVVPPRIERRGGSGRGGRGQAYRGYSQDKAKRCIRTR
jgi:hypothetical protein